MNLNFSSPRILPLVLALSVAVLAGCGRMTDTKSNSDSPGSAVPPSAPGATTKTGVPPQPSGPATRPNTDSMGRPADGTETSVGAGQGDRRDSAPKQQPPAR